MFHTSEQTATFANDALLTITTIVSVLLICLLWKRWETKSVLLRAGLPTVYWRPRFITYRPFQDNEKLSSSSITRILPRMKRMDGPYGMYGTVYGLNTAVVHVAHPTPARAILCAGAPVTASKSTRQSFIQASGACKAPAYDHFKNFCGEGVFTADGEHWKRKRAAILHCLIKGTFSSTSKTSHLLTEEANRAADDFCRLLEAERGLEKDDHVVTNVLPKLQRSTIGFIYRFLTHRDIPHTRSSTASSRERSYSDSTSQSSGSEQSTGTDIPSCKQTDSSASLLDEYLLSIVRIRMIILAQSRSIWFLLPRWCYRMFSSLYRDECKTVQPIQRFAREACIAASPGSPLALLTKFGAHGGEKHGKEEIESKVSQGLLDEAITILFAGQDTSAATLSWILHLLSLHPEIQTRVAAEIQGVVPNPSFVSPDMIQKMPLLDAVVKETMRLYPVAPFVVRRLTHNTPIDNKRENDCEKDVLLPKGSIACIWIYGQHRNPEFWDRPDDFVPARWMEEKLKDKGQSNGAYMPFAAGPRNCLGQPLARVVIRTILARLLLRFRFQDERLTTGGGGTHPNDLRHDMQAGFTILPMGGVTLTVHERKEMQ